MKVSLGKYFLEVLILFWYASFQSVQECFMIVLATNVANWREVPSWKGNVAFGNLEQRLEKNNRFIATEKYGKVEVLIKC